jgi:NAD(P)-dependent dehydrogenase (short-subunit alcohol dehydrogenase family)
MGLLDDKVILVVGGTSGIGEATAVYAAKEGAKVVVSGRRKELGEAVVEAIKAKGGTAVFVQWDATKEEEVKMLVDRCVEAFGRIDGAYNNCGIVKHSKPLTEVEWVEFEELQRANSFSILCAMKYEAQQMRRQKEASSSSSSSCSSSSTWKGGAIVNCSSINGIKPFVDEGLYSASKAAVDSYTKTAAVELSRFGIRVNSVQPGPILTDIYREAAATSNPPTTSKDILRNWGSATLLGIYVIPFFLNDEDVLYMDLTGSLPLIGGRAGEPEEVAAAVVFLLSDAASYITGVNLLVDGGMALK